jgi:hypothetical protein
MFRLLVSSGLAALLALAAAEASAQLPRSAPPRQLAHISSVSGIVQGVVVDDAGVVMPGATVLAFGTSLAVDVSDRRGRFQFTVPAGDYVLRATRDGYTPAARQVLRVHPRTTIERRITILRESRVEAAPAAPAPAAETPATAERAGDSHSEIAWRLRHLPRTVLRDVSHDPVTASTTVVTGPSSVADRLFLGSVRQTASFFADTAFTAQVNLLASTTMSPAGVIPAASSRGVADVVIGAPVGTAGDWTVRAAVGSDDAGSWTLTGDYRARPEHAHGVRLGVSYGAQSYVTGPALPARNLTSSSRSAGGVRVSDRWRGGAGRFELDYGGRLDRYDYLVEPVLAGGHAKVRARAIGQTVLVAGLSRDMVAPGADQFQPPSAPGPWLPPTRTFSPLLQRDGLNPEDVRTIAAGVEQRFGFGLHGSARIEWFSQRVSDQLATLFGLDEASEIGHYYVATPGSLRMDGWRARVSGDLHEHLHGSVALVSGRAEWTPRPGAWMALHREAPAVVRRGIDAVADLQSSLAVDVPATSTSVAFDYRMSLARRQEPNVSARVVRIARINLELRQQLPYQPRHSGEWTVLFTFRTLMHDRDGGSIYDELLTVRPPARMTGGLQVRF